MLIRLCMIVLLSFIPANDCLAKEQDSYHDQVAVLLYHHIDNHYNNEVTINEALLQQQLVFLKSKGVHFINYEQFLQFLSGEKIQDNAALITFDDGYDSFYTKAYPLLRNMHIPAVNFVITGKINTTNDSANRTYLSQQHITEMRKFSKDFSFQCHSDHLHTMFKNGSTLLTDRLFFAGIPETLEEYSWRIIKETEACRNKLSRLTHEPVHAYAYPYGVYNTEAIHLLQKSGIRYGFTTQSKMVRRNVNLMKIPRINAGNPRITPRMLYNSIIRRSKN